jgi:hypothetical protein
MSTRRKQRTRKAGQDRVPAVAAPPASAKSPADRGWWRDLSQEGLAWGVALVIFLRPWRDGLTFKGDNFYYLWLLAFLFALYLARVLIRGRQIRFGRMLGLAAAFLLVALATAPATINMDGTYRHLLYWSGHIMLFMMVADGLRTRLAFNIVLGAFLLTTFLEASRSILHYYYELPELRRLISSDPSVLVQNFGMEDLTPDLRHRLETNRAFGRFLFANALAAFLIIGIPYAMAAILPAIRDLRGAWRATTGVPPANEYRRLVHSGLVGLAAWLVAFVACVWLYPYFTGDADRLGRPLVSTILVGIIPLAVAAVPYILARVRGPRVTGLALRAAFFPMLLFVQVLCLYLTFSRGGILAIGLAVGAGALFLGLAWRGTLRRFGTPLAAAALLACLVGAGLGAPSWAQDAPLDQPPAPAVAAVPADGPLLDIAGRDLTAADMVNPASFFLRLTYWKVSWDIIKNYWMTGVGLGNFPTAYQRYQYLGAGDVNAAHNDYLQYFSETGVFGVLAFLGFWAYLLIAGGRYILGIDSRREQVYLTAMLAGVLAFLLHAVVDFPFVNPSLAFFQYLMAGMFLARLGLHLPERSGLRAHRVIAGVLLVLTAFTVGASLRVYFTDYVLGGRVLLNVGNPARLGQCAEGARYLLRAQRTFGTHAPRDELVSIVPVYSLIPKLEVIQSFSEIRVPADEAGRAYRAPAPGETIGRDAVIRITNAAEATEQGIQFSELWIAELEQVDGLYPHNSELALYLVGMYNELLQATSDQKAQMRYALKALEWAEEAIRRDRLQSVCWQYYGLALTYRANIEPSARNLDFYLQGIDAFKKATELYPIGHIHWYQYSNALEQVAALIRPREPARAEAMLEESRAARAQGDYIVRFRSEHAI